jgi:hypothetical protein
LQSLVVLLLFAVFLYLFLTLFAFIIDRTDAFAFALLGVHIFDPDA